MAEGFFRDSLLFLFPKVRPLYCHGIRRIIHNNTFPCIDGNLGIGDRQNVRDVDNAYAVIVNDDFLAALIALETF